MSAIALFVLIPGIAAIALMAIWLIFKIINWVLQKLVDRKHASQKGLS